MRRKDSEMGGTDVGLRDIDDLPKNKVNYTALTPLWFLERAATVYPERLSIVHGSVKHTWGQTYSRCRQLASALSRRSFGIGTTVSIIAPNIPALYEAHFAVPMTGSVINPINIRLNAETVSFLLKHSSTSVVMVDQEYFTLAMDALNILAAEMDKNNNPPLVIVIGDENCDPKPLQRALKERGVLEYENFLQSGDPEFKWVPPEDEWQSIALGYTSGTTSSPKGVVLSHRGAHLSSLGGILMWGMLEGSIYLWTLPLFHCNGWCFVWALAALCGTSICLRNVSAKAIYLAIANQGVTHFCAAPTVLSTILNASSNDTILPLPRKVDVMTAGAAPQPLVLAGLSRLGFRITHTYGLSETYGPSTVCTWKPEWDDLPSDTRVRLHARQGVRYISMEVVDVVDMTTMDPVPADGKTLGEIVFRGNMIMKGYLKNPEANNEAFKNGWYHSGDLGVKHLDGYIEVKDRAKDIIISGGENISSLEVEKVVFSHPAVLETSVIAREDEKWGESPCAFVTVRENHNNNAVNEVELAEDIIKLCKKKLPAFWVPKSIVFLSSLPKTATGKVQKHVLRSRVKELGPVRRRSNL